MASEPALSERDLARGGELVDRIVRFGRYLRLCGLPVTLGQVMDLVHAVPEIGLVRADFKLAARTTLVTRKEDGPVFDEAFDLYWKRATFADDGAEGNEELSELPPPEGAAESESKLPPPPRQNRGEEGGETATKQGQRQLEEGEAAEDAEPDVMLTYSANEVLKGKDFAQYTPEEIEQAKRVMEHITWQIGMRRSRRLVRSYKGRYLDLRRSLRTNMKYGGELIELSRRRQKKKPRQLVLICDISGSMDRYSRLLLQFLHTVEHGLSRVEVFVFGTRLTRITRQLRARNIDAALERVSREVQDWAGGTRIGESLQTFNTKWARRVLSRGAIVMVISDGWDRGDVDLLRKQMARLQRYSYRLIWLNPLLGSPTYQPLTRGIQAALPYVDDFLPVHNLHSLEELAEVMADVTSRRPVRRQTLHLPAVLDGPLPALQRR
ncbi:MAG TPA: VWA domain-containing protein [Thermomicrobiales bacterium]|nr:VWA domain-containing protein [Thermomicrobiales bacterium]